MAVVVSMFKLEKIFRIFLSISFVLLLCFFFTTHLQIPNSLVLNHSRSSNSTQESCNDLQSFKDHKTKCLYLSSKNPSVSQGYIDYLYLFYCICGRWPPLGYTLLCLWLLVLFYLLGNTASVYFCSSLEDLSRILNLSPTIAGVTLLALGNGAPDAFSSIVSFAGSGTGGFGLNGILGGAFFVSSVVIGIISICISPHSVSIEKFCFVRDICIFIVALASLLAILIIGRINIWGSISFTSLYLLYVFMVSLEHLCRKKRDKEDSVLDIAPLLPIAGSFFSHEHGEPCAPILCGIGKEQDVFVDKEAVVVSKTTWFGFNSPVSYYMVRLLCLLEMPLYLPRRLTIPVVCEEKWSKPFAVISVTLAPVLLAALWSSQKENMGFKETLAIYILGGSIGVVLGILAFVTTEKSTPPTKCLFLWLAGGFLMSLIWTYIIAEELVALLVSCAYILGISPSSLGLTVLAWGNSLGDLIANVALAMNGGPDGAQIAISGCYAGPIFITLIGLGLSFILSCWSQYPSSVVISSDPSLFQTLGFLMGGLLWALVILPRRGMILDRLLGGGLLVIYLCFLSLWLAQTPGLVQLFY